MTASVLPDPLAIPTTIDQPMDSTNEFDKSFFKWNKFRLGIESFDSEGSYDANNIMAYEKLAEESTTLHSCGIMIGFVMLVTLGIVLPHFLPLNSVDQGFDVRFLIFSSLAACLAFLGVWYCVRFYFPVKQTNLHRNVIKLSLMSTILLMLVEKTLSLFCWPLPFGTMISSVVTITVMALWFYCTEIRPKIKNAVKRKTSIQTNARLARASKGITLLVFAMNCDCVIYPIGIYLFTTYGSTDTYAGILAALCLRVVRQIVEVIMAKSIMSVKKPEPWLSVGVSNVYYLVYLGFVFQQSSGYTPTLLLMLLNVAGGFIKYKQVMKVKKLDATRPGLIKLSVLLIWFEDTALVDFCEIVIPTIYAIFLAFMFNFCPNREFFMLYKRENFDYNDLVQTEMSLVYYVAIEILSLVAKRHYIYQAFSVDLFKLLHFSLSKHGIKLGFGILSCFMYTLFTELDHVRNDWSMEVVKECLAL